MSRKLPVSTFLLQRTVGPYIRVKFGQFSKVSGSAVMWGRASELPRHDRLPSDFRRRLVCRSLAARYHELTNRSDERVRPSRVGRGATSSLTFGRA